MSSLGGGGSSSHESDHHSAAAAHTRVVFPHRAQRLSDPQSCTTNASSTVATRTTSSSVLLQRVPGGGAAASAATVVAAPPVHTTTAAAANPSPSAAAAAAFTAERAVSLMNATADVRPRGPAAASSSPSTPSLLSTSGSGSAAQAAHKRRGHAAAALPAAVPSPPGLRGAVSSGVGSSSTGGAPMSSASIHAAAARGSAAAAVPVPGPAAAAAAAAANGTVGGAGGGFLAPAASATGALSVSLGPASQPSSVPPLVSSLASNPEEAAAKEAQRRQILNLANALLTVCSIGNVQMGSMRVDSIRQCTSSFFVLLYQRLFDCTIAGIDRSPNSAEKRRHNVMLVLEQLRQHQYSLDGIEAEEVVRLNEDHISRLIMVFVQVAHDRSEQQQQLHAAAAPGEAGASAAAAAAPTVMLGDENSAAGRGGSGAYAPVGYTVAEVMPPAAPHAQHPTAASQPPPPQQQHLNVPGWSGGAAGSLPHQPHLHHYHQTTGDFYVAPAPPLNGGAGGLGGAELVADGKGDNAMSGESPSSVSYYLDSSVMPTDDLMKEWYRNLVSPATGSLAEDTTEVLSAVDPGHVSMHGGHSQRRQPRSDRYGRDAGVSLTSSGSPLYQTGPAHATPQQQQLHHPQSAAQPARRRSPGAPLGRSPQRQGQRSHLQADDIVYRCQRLEEVLDSRQRRQQQLQQTPAQPQPQFQESVVSPSGAGARSPARAGPLAGGTASPPATAAAAAPAPPHAASTATPAPAAAALSHPTPPQPSRMTTARAPAASAPPPPPAPPRRAPLPVAPEPPLTRQERELLAHRPLHRSVDAAQRDLKIERMRSARYLGDMQQLLCQRMRREYDTQMSAMRGSLKESIRSARVEKIDLMRHVRDENARYRAAYATLMAAAANEAQVPARVMSRHTAQLADFYATSLQHSQAMCESLTREADRRTKEELLRYAQEVSAWQQHFLA